MYDLQKWNQLPFFHTKDLEEVADFIDTKVDEGKVIVPIQGKIFAALQMTPPQKVKVVILGQDPYPGKDQANGLAFSVNRGHTIPASLHNIFHELYMTHYKLSPFPKHGDLTKWAHQGVLLLNSSLTTELNVTNAHPRLWVNLIIQVLQFLNSQPNIVYILWGKNAQYWKYLLTNKEHMIIESSHPSPLSAHLDFFGSDPFGRANMYLLTRNLGTIDWRLDQ